MRIEHGLYVGDPVPSRRKCAYPDGYPEQVGGIAYTTPSTMTDIGNADRVELMQRLVALQIEHRDLDDVIRRLANDPGRDQLQLTRMKRRKLMLKDQIARLERQIDPDVLA